MALGGEEKFRRLLVDNVISVKQLHTGHPKEGEEKGAIREIWVDDSNCPYQVKILASFAQKKALHTIFQLFGLHVMNGGIATPKEELDVNLHCTNHHVNILHITT